MKWESSVRKMESESSKTSGTEETPFLDSATQRYCLMAFMNISLVLKMGPAFWRMDSSSWRDKTFDRSSWDLRQGEERNKPRAELYSGKVFCWYSGCWSIMVLNYRL